MRDVTGVRLGLFGLSWDEAKKWASGKYPLPVRRDAWQGKKRHILRDDHGTLRTVFTDDRDRAPLSVPLSLTLEDAIANDWAVGPAMGVAK